MTGAPATTKEQGGIELGAALSVLTGAHRVEVAAYRSELLAQGRRRRATTARVTGTAVIDGRTRAFSVVRKDRWADQGARDEGSPGDWRREAALYRSGHLLRLPPGSIRAPRCLLVTEGPDHVRIWLEDVHGTPLRLRPGSLLDTARRLGRFNGSPEGAEGMSAGWLNHDWSRLHYGPRVDAAHAKLRRMCTNHRRLRHDGSLCLRLRTASEAEPAVLRVLATLPRAFCHHDLHVDNVLVPGDPGADLAAVDWEHAGPGPFGADLAGVLFSAVRRASITPATARELERPLVDAYVLGLRDSGWDGAVGQVRLGFRGAMALRWRVGLRTVHDTDGAGPRRWAARLLRASMSSSGIERALVELVLDHAEAARSDVWAIG